MTDSQARLAVERPVISARAALAATQAALAHAESLGVAVNIAVVDAGGLLAGFVRMPGAPMHCIDIAIDKAYTAAGFGVPTGQWEEVFAKHHSAAVRQGLLQRPRFVAFGGGLPIELEAQRIGAIGVSGASEQQDEAIAQAGVQALAA